MTTTALNVNKTVHSGEKAARRRKLSGILYYLLMIAISCIYFYPIIWLVLSSFRENRDIFSSPFGLPEQIRFSNWSEAWNIGNMSTYAKNSVIVTSATVVCILLFASLAAFAFSKLRFRGSGLLMTLFLLGLFMPLQSFFIAQSYIFERLSLKDTYLGLIVPYIGTGLPLAVFLLKAYLDSVPRELMEAARMDGCGDFLMYRKIIVPLLIPSMATVGIFSALNAWNELLLAMLYIQQDALKTIPVGLLAFSSRYMTDYKLLFSALALITLPMIVVYIFFHRFIVAGLTEGALK
ncbi:carbohydrate ABC transporter permease [Paenibacillus sp. HN-1]|uniref:carbohydrate ABC transporter permease n=1 Tax=Paenibacillus TaxID=44249 RepID=UPI001CA841D2|nr:MULTISPECIES: carbohydrate ABC transporter permease [Paenibacillus]MBY9077572.1 carbohydrate ABC transporter permease [Paenibacillus sp. CGMCC 1.18879]MBY9087843.1 carbohydrate ABC transporter permease [Paenibacillus sinensis]